MTNGKKSQMMYRVVWKIDIDADSHREAAEKALRIHRNPDSIATVFDVIGPAPGQSGSKNVLRMVDVGDK